MKLFALLLALAVTSAGCAAAPAAMAIAPAAVQAVGVMAGSQYVKSQGKEMDGQMEEETTERCDALKQSAPGVEELRRTKDGAIESRQWRVGSHDGAPAWIHAQQDEGPDGGWAPRQGLQQLGFSPPLGDQLDADKSKFIVYAPTEINGPTDTEVFDTMTSAFGAGQGKFKWRGHDYAYVMVSRLPCFKVAK